MLETVTFFLIRMLPAIPFMGKEAARTRSAPVAGQLRTGTRAPLSSTGYWWNMLFGPRRSGASLVKEGISVADSVSLQLGVLGMVISIMGNPAGILGALYKNRWIDWWVMLVSMAGIFAFPPSSWLRCWAWDWAHARARPERRGGTPRLCAAACPDASS